MLIKYTDLVKELSSEELYSEEMLEMDIDDATKSLETSINNSEFMSYYLKLSTESICDKVNMYKRIGKVYNLDATRSIESTISNGIKRFTNAIINFITTIINLIMSFFTYISENIFKVMKHLLIEGGNIKEIDEEKRKALLAISDSSVSTEARVSDENRRKIRVYIDGVINNCVNKCGSNGKLSSVPIFNILNVVDKDEVWINNMYRYSKFIENYFENYLKNDINMISSEADLIKDLVEGRNINENKKKYDELVINSVGGKFKDLYSEYTVKETEFSSKNILDSYLKHIKMVDIKQYNFRLHKYIDELESSLRNSLKSSLRELTKTKAILKTTLGNNGLQKYNLDFKKTTDKYYTVHKNTSDSLIAIKCIGFCVCGRLRIRNMILKNIEK